MTQSATVPTIYKDIIRQTPFSFDGMELELSKTGIVEDAENLKNDQLDTELIQIVTLQEVTKARPEEAIFEPQELPTPTRREIESWTPDQVYAHICRVIPEILHEDNEETRKILNAEKIDGRAFILCGEDDFVNIEINHADALGREVYRLRVALVDLCTVERSPDFEDIAEMNAEQVAAFLIARAKEGELELQKDDLNIISYWKIPGIALLQQDEERLIRLGLPEKSANYIAKVINRIRGEYGILSMPMYRKPDGITGLRKKTVVIMKLAENSQQESNMSACATMRGDQLESFMTVTERPIDESQQVLVRIAESNEVPIEWPELKYIIKSQLSKMREEGTEETDAVNGLYSKLLEERNKLLEDIIKRLDKFNETPFTIQRVAELMIKPHEYYVNTVKWLRGLEKVLSVHSSTKSFPDGGQVEASLTLSEADTADIYGSIHDAEETTRNELNADDQSMDEDEAEAYLDAVINGDESVNNDEENITVRATENFYYGLLSMDSTDE